MTKQSKHSIDYAQSVDRGQSFAPNNYNSEQQKNLRFNEQNEEYNRQLKELMVIVKEAGCKFGNFSYLDNSKETG